MLPARRNCHPSCGFDKRNTVLTLTEDYVNSVVAQLRKDKKVKSRRHSDPATVTREQAVKDSAFAVKEVNDSLAKEEADTIQIHQ